MFYYELIWKGSLASLLIIFEAKELFLPIYPTWFLIGKMEEVFSKFISWPNVLLFVFTHILPTIEFIFGVEPENEDIILDIFSRSVILSIEFGKPPLKVLIFFNLSIS